MKIGLVHTALVAPTGGERQVLRLAVELKKRGHEVRVYTIEVDRARCFPDLLDQLDVVEVRPQGLPRAVMGAGLAAKLDGLARAGMLSLGRAVEAGTEVVNAHNPSGNWAAARAKKRLRVPAVWMCNEPPFWFSGPQARRPWQNALARRGLEGLDPEGAFLRFVDVPAARAMDRIVVLDQKNVDRVKSRYGRDATIVRSGLDVEVFERPSDPAVREKQGLSDKFVILHVGYAAAWKGQDFSLRVLQKLRARVPEAHVVFVGGGVQAKYGALAQELGVAGSVSYLEGIPDEELVSYYHACDVVVFPADQTWGLTVIEAMASGRPSVTSREAGVSEVVSDGVTGFVLPHGDEAAWVDTLTLLSKEPHLRRDIGAAARDYARRHLNWGNYAEGMLAVFRDALEKR